MAPKGNPIPGMYDCIKLYGKRDFTDAIKSRILNWGDYPGLYRQGHVITRETGKSESDKDTGRYDAAESNNRGQGHKVTMQGWPKMIEKARKQILPQNLQKEHSLADTLKMSDLQNCKIRNLCCFKLLSSW